MPEPRDEKEPYLSALAWLHVGLGREGVSRVIDGYRAVFGAESLTADNLRRLGYTAAHAEADGFTIDRHCYPWVAYRGPRFDTNEFVFLHPEATDFDSDVRPGPTKSNRTNGGSDA